MEDVRTLMRRVAAALEALEAAQVALQEAQDSYREAVIALGDATYREGA